MDEPIKRSPRSDGKRNRDKLLKAATPLAQAGGDEFSLDQVARDAGVSIATLYRHFPTREALLLEISQQDAAHYRERAADLLKTMRPVEALGQWLGEMSRYGLTRPGMSRAFRAAAAYPVGETVYRTFLEALDSLLKAGHHEGTIRSDLTAEDILLALCGLWDLKDSPETRAQCGRLSRLLVDGLQASAREPD